MPHYYFSANFLLSTGVGVYSNGDKALLYLNLAMVIGGAITAIIAGRQHGKHAFKILLQRFASLLLTMGIIALIWSVLREQGVVMISSHVVVLAVYLIALIWLIMIIRYEATDYQVLAEAERREEERQKYLPKKQK